MSLVLRKILGTLWSVAVCGWVEQTSIRRLLLRRTTTYCLDVAECHVLPTMGTQPDENGRLVTHALEIPTHGVGNNPKFRIALCTD